MDRTPTRETRAAETQIRRGWHGLGHLSRTEKNWFGCLLHDLSTVTATIGFSSVFVLYAVILTPETSAFGVIGTTVVSLLTLIAVGVAVRGGWIHPPLTETPGWLSMTPWLVLFRILYYNGVLLLTVFGTVVVADAVGTPVLALVLAFVGSLLAGLLVPTLGDRFYDRVTNR